MDKTVDGEIRTAWPFEKGWGRRPKHGETLVRNTVHLHEKQIGEMLEGGNGKKGKR